MFMRILFLLIILFAPCCEAIYRFCPDAGHYTPSGQYENQAGGNGAGVLYFPATATAPAVTLDVSEYDKPLDPKLAAYLEKITWHKGKVDRAECIQIAAVGLSAAYDAFTTHQAIGRGCMEMNRLLGVHPSPGVLAAFVTIKVGIIAIPALLTPLYKSSAPVMTGTDAFLTYSALKAAAHNKRCLR